MKRILATTGLAGVIGAALLAAGFCAGQRFAAAETEGLLSVSLVDDAAQAAVLEVHALKRLRAGEIERARQNLEHGLAADRAILAIYTGEHAPASIARDVQTRMLEAIDAYAADYPGAAGFGDEGETPAGEDGA